MKLKFLSIYRKLKDIFVKPKFKWYFGKWINDTNPPIIKRGNYFRFCEIDECAETWNYSEGKLVDSVWTDEGKEIHPFLSKIIKPSYCLPMWLRFGIFNGDVEFTVKYGNSIRIDGHPFISLVFFGWCISVKAVSPEINSHCEEDYWESMISYKYFNGNLADVIINTGKYLTSKNNKHWTFDTRFLKREEDKKEVNKLRKEDMLRLNDLPNGVYFNKDLFKVIKITKYNDIITQGTSIMLTDKSNIYRHDDSTEYVKIIQRPYYKYLRFFAISRRLSTNSKIDNKTLCKKDTEEKAKTLEEINNYLKRK